MKILVISNNYPSLRSPSDGAFVYNLVQQFVNLGHTLSIISVEGYSFSRKPKELYSTYGKELGQVFRPKFLSTSAKKIFNFNTFIIGEWGQVKAIERTVIKHKIEFDVVYAHFLDNAFIAVRALSKYGKPIYVAVGESNLEARELRYTKKYLRKSIAAIDGFIPNSPILKDKLIAYGAKKDKIIVRPNGVDLKRFTKRDKIEMRRRHNLPLDKKLVIFVGRFINQKGPLRVLKATSKMSDIGLIFIGSGVQKFESDKIVFKGKVPSEIVPELLSAADIFVLPTLKEGNCNAIVEAMACGLPIVSSKIPEVEVQCDPSFSILVDPMKVNEIAKAIDLVLNDDEKAQTMSKNSIKIAKKLDITERAKSILEFINP